MDEEIEITDNSGDKKYFSQLPHYILNHSSAIDQALYWQMKRFAGENGKCFATKETLMKKMRIGRKSLEKSIKYLIDKKWIKFSGKVKGKTRDINSYEIVDIWKLNINNYEEIESRPKKGFGTNQLNLIPSKETLNPFQRTIEEEPKEEELKSLLDKSNKEQQTTVAGWNFKDKLEQLIGEKRRDLHIIGLYWRHKEFNFENSNQFQSSLKRDLRPVKSLVGYTDEQIIDTMDWLIHRTDIKFTLETIHKYIDEDLNRIKSFKNKYGK